MQEGADLLHSSHARVVAIGRGGPSSGATFASVKGPPHCDLFGSMMLDLFGLRHASQSVDLKG